jgi:hypothetical protein
VLPTPVGVIGEDAAMTDTPVVEQVGEHEAMSRYWRTSVFAVLPDWLVPRMLTGGWTADLLSETVETLTDWLVSDRLPFVTCLAEVLSGEAVWRDETRASLGFVISRMAGQPVPVTRAWLTAAFTNPDPAAQDAIRNSRSSIGKVAARYRLVPGLGGLGALAWAAGVPAREVAEQTAPASLDVEVLRGLALLRGFRLPGPDMFGSDLFVPGPTNLGPPST